MSPEDILSLFSLFIKVGNDAFITGRIQRNEQNEKEKQTKRCSELLNLQYCGECT